MATMKLFVGIDIARADFVVTRRPVGETWLGPQDPAGIRTTCARLQKMAPTLMVLEATGGYETALVAALAAAALPVVVVHPRRVRDFANATGQLAKTDRLDAARLARFAERVPRTPRPGPGGGNPAQRCGERARNSMSANRASSDASAASRRSISRACAPVTRTWRCSSLSNIGVSL